MQCAQIWLGSGRSFNVALSPHRRLCDRPTTAMASGPTGETCLRRTCRFPIFFVHRAGRTEVGSNCSMGFFLFPCSFTYTRSQLAPELVGFLVYWRLDNRGGQIRHADPRRRRGFGLSPVLCLSTSKFQPRMRQPVSRVVIRSYCEGSSMLIYQKKNEVFWEGTRIELPHTELTVDQSELWPLNFW
jgi:hypothetical protein